MLGVYAEIAGRALIGNVMMNRPYNHPQRHRRVTWIGLVGVVSCLLMVVTTGQAGDQATVTHGWPTFRQNVARTGSTAMPLQTDQLGEVWRHQASHWPQPAWPGPAKWDAYAGIKGLRSMRNYDPVYHTAVADGRLIYAGNVDDTLRCLDMKTGEIMWETTLGGPIRIAPTIHDGLVYVGSDDGYAYAMDDNDGGVVWKFSPTEGQRQVLNNGRLISFQPVRTGVHVRDGIAYFGASLLPWEPSYLCAVDAKTGEVDPAKTGKATFVRRLSDRTLEGAMLVADDRLIAPQGRVAPMLFKRDSGEPMGTLQGGGGVFCVLTDDGHILHGPGNKLGWITDSNADSREKIAAFNKGNALVVSGHWAFLITDDELVAVDRTDRKVIWKQPRAFSFEIILVGEHVVVGGHDEVTAYDAKTGNPTWQGRVKGRAYGLAAAEGKLLVSTDEGTIHAFGQTTSPLVDEDANDSADPPSQAKAAAQQPLPPSPHVKPLRRRGLIDTFTFHRSAMRTPDKKPVTGNVACDVVLANLSSDRHAVLQGGGTVHRVEDVEVLELDGDSLLEVSDNIASIDKPKRHITAAAWVRIDAPAKWGGIVGMVQDNGSYERGWVLGYNGNHFSFAVAGAEKNGRIHYMQAAQPFVNGSWHFVVGTYDGRMMRLYVDGRIAATSDSQVGDIRYPEKAWFIIGAYRDNDERFPMKGALHEVQLYDRVLSEREIEALYVRKRRNFPEPATGESPKLAAGPLLRFTAPDQAELYWETDKPSPSVVKFGVDDDRRVIEDLQPKREHRVEIDNLRRAVAYQYQIQTEPGQVSDAKLTSGYEADAFFNYTLAPVNADDDAEIVLDADVMDHAKSILAESFGTYAPNQRGLVVIFSSLDEASLNLARALVRHSELRVQMFTEDQDAANQARASLIREGVYGQRIAVSVVPDATAMKTPSAFADLVYVATQDEQADVIAEACRMVRPQGGVIFVATDATEADGTRRAVDHALSYTQANQPAIEVNLANTHGVLARKGNLPGSGQWTHNYATAGKSAFGGEELANATGREELAVQWFGRPGPRYQSDRGNRKPTPLAVNGRMYLQGLERIIAVNQYNGTILWALEVPHMRRFNITRDTSNWCADEDYLYVAVRDRVWKFDGRDGRVIRNYDLKKSRHPWDQEWAYIARHGDQLIGSATKQGSAFTKWWGGAHWYDAHSGGHAAKVSSDNLFALDLKTGRTRWTYNRGIILNSTIAISDDRVYFIETRHPSVMDSDLRRVNDQAKWDELYLVAIDVKTGRPEFDEKINIAPGSTAFYMIHAENRLIISSSGSGKFNIYAINPERGKQLWHKQVNWESNHHGKHLSRPAVSNGIVYVRPAVLDLNNGEMIQHGFPGGHTCSSYALTTKASFFRAGVITMWNPRENQITRFPRMRPDCWLSIITAGGMLLTPEGGGGCSCGSWMETSIGFMPIQHEQQGKGE